jgi:imidazolonepropionase-like amidohydrolase
MTDPVVISDVTVIDCVAGSEPYRATVTIVGDRISAIGAPPETVEPGTTLVDGTGRYLIPGLWNTHCHLIFTADGSLDTLPSNVPNAQANIRSCLRSGVTSAVDLGGPKDELIPLRKRQRDGEVIGARVFLNGAVFTAPGGHPASTIFGGDPHRRSTCQVVNVEQATESIERLIAEDEIDIVKAAFTSWGGLPRLPRAALEAVVGIAQSHGVPVTAHIDTVDDAVRALEIGVSSLEHIFYYPGDELATCVDTVAELCEEKDAFWTPTVTVFEAYGMGGRPDFITGLGIDGFVADYILRDVVDASSWWMTQDKDFRDLFYRRYETGMAAMGRLLSSKVKFVAGTDAGAAATFHGPSVHREIWNMVQAGMAARDALESATRRAAEKLRVEHDLGTVEVGKYADLVLLRANPLADIGNTLRIERVIQAGRVFDPEEIDVAAAQ